jgi:hypothetical protein
VDGPEWAANKRRKTMPNVLSAAEMSVLEKEFKADAAAAPDGIKDIFCKGWPAARAVIEALLKIVTNPVVKVVLKLVEDIGDAAYSHCPK